MAEIGADDEARRFVAPETFQHFRDLLSRDTTRDQRQEREVAKHLLEEGNVDLKRMLLAVWLVVEEDLRHIPNRRNRTSINGDITERRLKSLRLGYRDAVKCHPMGGADQHDPFDLVSLAAPGGIGIGGNLSGIDVTRVRCDQRLWSQRRRNRSGGKVTFHIRGKCLLIGRIEEARDRRVSHVSHYLSPLAARASFTNVSNVSIIASLADAIHPILSL